MDDEQCPNCWEFTDPMELMTHGGFCQVCHDDGCGEEDDDA